MNETNTLDQIALATVETAELAAIEGGVWWCGTGRVDIFGHPVPTPPVIDILTGKPITNI
jgi:hypothetical protein